MQKLIDTQYNLFGTFNKVEIYLSNKIPDLSLCTAAYSFVFKDGKFLQTELKEGERPERRFDIPGGHIDKGESPEQAVIRETFEETGVIINNLSLFAFMKITSSLSREENTSDYPYPTSYMLFYLCDLVSEEEFFGNDEVHCRVWVSEEEFENLSWIKENKILFNEVWNFVKNKENNAII